MATKEATVEEQAAPEESGPVVLHARTIWDDNSYVQFGSAEESSAFEQELNANSPGKFSFETHALTDAQELLDENPPPEEEPEVNPLNPKPVARASSVPDRATLEATSRADLDEIAEENGLDPDDYRNKGEIVDALDKARS